MSLARFVFESSGSQEFVKPAFAGSPTGEEWPVPCRAAAERWQWGRDLRERDGLVACRYMGQ